MKSMAQCMLGFWNPHLIRVNKADELVAAPEAAQAVAVDVLLWPLPASGRYTAVQSASGTSVHVALCLALVTVCQDSGCADTSG